MTIGVLALQGGFDPHRRALESLNQKVVLVKTWDEIAAVDALVIPGGESTTIGKLLVSHGIMLPLRQRIADGLPVFGTCAGMILLAAEVKGPPQPLIGGLDITVNRNAYGRQVESFETSLFFEGLEPAAGQKAEVPAIFIRAPQVIRLGKDVRVLASYEGRPVCVRQGRILAASFHPELTEDRSIHRCFLEIIAEKGRTGS